LFVWRNGVAGYFTLGGVFLAVTGLEALYADLGHFTAWPVRISWTFLVFPSLMFQYIGQAALCYDNPVLLANPFFYMVPSYLTAPLVVLATIATIIASQALISGSFSLAAQAVNLRIVPPLTVKHTSKEVGGQIFVPFVNYLVMILTLLLAFGFQTSASITNAYGFTVCMMMAITTVCYAIAIVCYFRKSIFLAMLFFLFMFFDSLFLGAVSYKVPQGGWVAIMIAVVLSFSMLVWMYGERRLAKFLREHYEGLSIKKLVEILPRSRLEDINGDFDEDKSKKKKSSGEDTTTTDSKKKKKNKKKKVKKEESAEEMDEVRIVSENEDEVTDERKK